MFARFHQSCNPITRLFLSLSVIAAAACAPMGGGMPALSLPTTTPGTVQVALLVPGGTEEGSDIFLAQNLENAARLAIADLQGADIRLQVYTTGADPEQAAQVARQAVDEGAQIILGPLFAEAANAAGVAVAGSDVNVLAFSNNPAIAGGNVFILGATFGNTAQRLVDYTARQGTTRYMIVHGDDTSGAAGRDAITAAIAAQGAQLVATDSYPLSQQGIFSSTQRLVDAAQAASAQAVFTTASANADLPIIATALPDAGLDLTQTRLLGLTRWDVVPQMLALPGLQDGLFAMPDQGPQIAFENRYMLAYGSLPHPLAGLAYDGIAAIGALAASGAANPFTREALTAPQGFLGTSGVFRLLPNGQNERALSVATIQQNQVVILEQAPRNFASAGL